MYQKALEKLKKELVEYAEFVEKMIDDCIEGLLMKDDKILKKVIDICEPVADKKELKLEEHCIETIGLYEPKASELRTVLMIMKMGDDLERVADHVENICESGIFLSDKTNIKPLIDIPKMAQISRSMLRGAVESFIRQDAEAAKFVHVEDEVVDELTKQIFTILTGIMSKDSSTVERAMHIIRIAHNFERIGDLATNLCEDVIYMIDGKVIKHKIKNGDKF